MSLIRWVSLFAFGISASCSTFWCLDPGPYGDTRILILASPTHQFTGEPNGDAFAERAREAKAGVWADSQLRLTFWTPEGRKSVTIHGTCDRLGNSWFRVPEPAWLAIHSDRFELEGKLQWGNEPWECRSSVDKEAAELLSAPIVQLAEGRTIGLVVASPWKKS